MTSVTEEILHDKSATTKRSRRRRMNLETDVSSLGVSDNPVVDLGIVKIDRLSVYVFIVAIIAWYLLWKHVLQLHELESRPMKWMYYAGFVFFGVMMLTSSTQTSDYQTEVTIITNIDNYAALVASSSFALALLASLLIDKGFIAEPKHWLRILLVGLTFSMMTLLYVSLDKTGKAVRFLRKIKENTHNFGVLLAIAAVVYALSTRGAEIGLDKEESSMAPSLGEGVSAQQVDASK